MRYASGGRVLRVHEDARALLASHLLKLATTAGSVRSGWQLPQHPSARPAKPTLGLSSEVGLQRLLDGPQDGVHDLGGGLIREALGQSLSADVEDVADGLLCADLCDILRECTLEPLQSGIRGTSELGNLTSQAERRAPIALGKGEKDQDARGGFNGNSQSVQFGGGVFGKNQKAGVGAYKYTEPAPAWLLCLLRFCRLRGATSRLGFEEEKLRILTDN